MKEIKHIIFDMDGVIIDTEPEYKRRLKYFLEVKGYEVSDDLCNKTCGSSLKDAYRILKNEINNFDMSFEQYVSEKRNILKNDIIDIAKILEEPKKRPNAAINFTSPIPIASFPETKRPSNVNIPKITVPTSIPNNISIAKLISDIP